MKSNSIRETEKKEREQMCDMVQFGNKKQQQRSIAKEERADVGIGNQSEQIKLLSALAQINLNQMSMWYAKIIIIIFKEDQDIMVSVLTFTTI
jgi:hypothetical protein